MVDHVGVCVIGAGRAGMIHAQNFSTRVPNARLVAVADPSEEALSASREALGLQTTFRDYQDALADERIHAVVVVAPTVYHREIVVAAAQAGKHILCEKPMAMDSSECRDMIDAAGRGSVKLQIGFMRRFDHSFRDAYDRLSSGEIGAVNQVKSLTHGPSVPQPWMLDIGKSNGPLAEVCSHDIDTVRWFGGADIVEVYAKAGNFRCRDRAGEYPDFYDTVGMLCSLRNGVQGFIDGAVSVGYGYDARAEILGENGIILVGDLRGSTATTYKRGWEFNAATVRSWRDLFSDAYLQEDLAFIGSIREDTAPAVSGHDGLQAVQVVNAGNESIRTGKPVGVGE